MNCALPSAFIAKTNRVVLLPIVNVITPLWSAPIEYVPVNGCATSATSVPIPFVSSSPFVRLPAPSAVNLPTAAKADDTFVLPLIPLNVNT